MERYNHKEVEKKWQKEWKENSIYETENKVEGKENYYILVEFPYPSGNLHVGHWYAYAVPDIFARFHRLNGKNVIFPIGFDAFGLPAENAAIKNNVNPREWTEKNIEYMKTQIESMGSSYDWSREVITCREDYYKWTQWLFIQLFNAGLVVRSTTEANWCSDCKTVLANEQVIDNLCERCNTKVIKKDMPQWRIKITDYADRLIDDLDELDWPEDIKVSQKNWIGRSQGAEIDFSIKNSKDKIKIFTTRADTLFGVTYLVLAPEHKVLNNLKSKILNFDKVSDYIEKSKKISEIDRMDATKIKTGVKLEGLFAINPANNEEIPIFVADYVLASYGTGAIMAVPAHDERDYEFAKKYNLEIRKVIEPLFIDKTVNSSPRKELPFIERNVICAIVKHCNEDKYLTLDWKKADWTTFITGGIEVGQTAEESAITEVLEETGYKNLKLIKNLGKSHSKLFHNPKNENRFAHFESFYFELENTERDEISQEEKEKHDIVWRTSEEIEKEIQAGGSRSDWDKLQGKDLIKENGYIINSNKFNGRYSEDIKKDIINLVGGRITNNYKLRDWGVSRQRYWGCPIPLVKCSECGYVAEKTDNLPVRLPIVEDYLPNDDGRSPLSKNENFVKTKCPKCSRKATRETDTLDTFVDSSWYFLRYCDPKNLEEFANKEKLKDFMPIDFYSGGAEHTTMHLLYSRFFHKALFDLDLVNENEPYKIRMNRGLIMGPDGNKMSKSKGNVINPDEIVQKLGADTMRIYLSFIGPYNKIGSYPWNPESIVGVRRFIERTWKLQYIIKEKENKKIDIALNKALNQVIDSIKTFKINTGVSALMSCLNFIEKEKSLNKEQLEFFIKILSPYAPHVTEEIWNILGNKNSIHFENWKKVDNKLLVESTIELVVQVNGKLRSKISIENGKKDDELEKIALDDEKIKKFTKDCKIKKIIIIKSKLVNIVI